MSEALLHQQHRIARGLHLLSYPRDAHHHDDAKPQSVLLRFFQAAAGIGFLRSDFLSDFGWRFHQRDNNCQSTLFRWNWRNRRNGAGFYGYSTGTVTWLWTTIQRPP